MVPIFRQQVPTLVRVLLPVLVVIHFSPIPPPLLKSPVGTPPPLPSPVIPTLVAIFVIQEVLQALTRIPQRPASLALLLAIASRAPELPTIIKLILGPPLVLSPTVLLQTVSPVTTTLYFRSTRLPIVSP